MKLKQEARIAWRELDGQAVLVEPSDGTVTVLNESGTRLWARLEEPQTLEALAAFLAGRYALSLADALRDAEAFAEHLASRKLARFERGNA